MVLAVASTVIFFLTEDLANYMRIVDKFTVLMAVLAVLEIVAAVIAHSKKKQSNDKDEEKEQATEA